MPHRTAGPGRAAGTSNARVEAARTAQIDERALRDLFGQGCPRGISRTCPVPRHHLLVGWGFVGDLDEAVFAPDAETEVAVCSVHSPCCSAKTPPTRRTCA